MYTEVVESAVQLGLCERTQKLRESDLVRTQMAEDCLRACASVESGCSELHQEYKILYIKILSISKYSSNLFEDDFSTQIKTEASAR